MEPLEYLQGKPQKYLMDGTKLIYHTARLQSFLEHRRIAPIHIDMGIHKACNIKCVYCYGVKQGKTTEYIPEDRLLMIAEDAHKVGVKSLAIIGDGEPTMNKGLYPFVEKCKQLKVDCAVATNGLLLGLGQVITLTDSCTWLRFNVSGVKKYEKVMGAPKGSFDKFEKVVKSAVKHKGNCTIGLQMVLIPECFSEIIPLTKKALEWGVDYLVIKQFSDGGKGMPMHFNMKEYKNAEDNLRKASEMATETTAIVVKWQAIKDTKDITMDKHWGFDRCIDLPFLFQVSGNGKCYPCGYLFGNHQYCYGDLCNQRLSEILSSEHYWRIIQKVAETPLQSLCHGQCRHCETNKFMDRLVKTYKEQPNKQGLRDALIEMCGSVENLVKTLYYVPEHMNFI